MGHHGLPRLNVHPLHAARGWASYGRLRCRSGKLYRPAAETDAVLSAVLEVELYHHLLLGRPEDIVDLLWGEISSACTFNPAAGHAWEYGCNLGLPTGSASDVFNNRSGWDFTTRSGNPNPGSTVVRGRVPIAPERGRMKLSAHVPLAQDLDLAAATVSVDRLVHEEGGAGELGHSLARVREQLEAHHL